MRRHLCWTVLLVVAVLAGGSPAGAADSDGDGVGNRRDRCPTVRADRPDGCPLGRWYLRNSHSDGPADADFRFASVIGQPLAGDWDGDGTDAVGTFDPQNERWRLAPEGLMGLLTPQANFSSIMLQDVLVSSLTGDWNGDGTDTIGLYVPATGTFFLRNSNTPGPADIEFSFGGTQPRRFVTALAGDWNGDGVDTVGLFRRDTDRWRLRNSNSAGPPDLLFTYGRPGSTELPLVGDWNGDGDVGIGVALMEEEGIFYYFRQTPTPGPVETQFSWGEANAGGWGVVVGDWNNDGTDSVGIRR